MPPIIAKRAPNGATRTRFNIPTRVENCAVKCTDRKLYLSTSSSICCVKETMSRVPACLIQGGRPDTLSAAGSWWTIDGAKRTDGVVRTGGRVGVASGPRIAPATATVATCAHCSALHRNASARLMGKRRDDLRGPFSTAFGRQRAPYRNRLLCSRCFLRTANSYAGRSLPLCTCKNRLNRYDRSICGRRRCISVDCGRRHRRYTD
jgi:hypothetical protein